MKPPRWTVWMLPAILLLPAMLAAQQHEHIVTTALLIGNVVYASNDQPAEQASVELWNVNGAPVASTLSSWGGEFFFSELAPGEYLVSVDKPGCEPAQQKVRVPLETKRVTFQLKRNRAADAAVVSVRDLSIPPKAQIALMDGIGMLKTDLPQAMASLQRAVALFPQYYEAYHVMGMANLMMERTPDAVEAFHKSIELSEHRYARPLMALGAVLCDRGEFAEAESAIREGLDLDGSPWIGHLVMARALFGLHRWNEAEQSAQEAILRQPELPDAYLLLVHIHSQQNNVAAVIEDLDHFLTLEPDTEIGAQAKMLREELWREDRPGDKGSSILMNR